MVGPVCGEGEGETLGDGVGEAGLAETVAFLTSSGIMTAAVWALSFMVCCQLFVVPVSEAVMSRGSWLVDSVSSSKFAVTWPTGSVKRATVCLLSGSQVNVAFEKSNELVFCAISLAF